tara:strand:+ start:507 stop:1940 length:1434 start_codon:yes stop_codon:yes gene_type:complete
MDRRSVLDLQVEALYRQAPVLLISGAVVGLAMVPVFFDRVPSGQLFVWLMVLWAVCALRGLIWSRYRRRDPAGDDTALWHRLFIAGSAATGAVWGATALVLFVPGSPVHQMFLAVVILGLVSAASSSLASSIAAYCWHAVPLVTPLFVVFLAEGDRLHLVLAFLLLLATVSVTLLARNHQRLLARNLRLIEERGALLHDLAVARDRAEQGNIAKSEFLAHVSHELRTPLNGIVGYADLLRTAPYGPIGNEKYREFVENIVISGRHLNELINDIIDVARVESGKFDLVEAAFDVRRVIAESVRLIKPMADSAGVQIEEQVPDAFGMMRGDRRRVMQILLNLLSNAVKFTPEGGRITISARHSDGGIVLGVRDTGIGMGAEDIPTALTPFGQISAPLRPNMEGTGLGLPLADALTTLHGGRLVIESSPGAGTEVTAAFPPERTVDPSTLGSETDLWAQENDDWEAETEYENVSDHGKAI